MTHGIDVYDFVHDVEEETEDGEYPFISPNYLGSWQATNQKIFLKFCFIQLMQYGLSRKYITFVGLSIGFVVYYLIGHTQRKPQGLCIYGYWFV